MKTRSLPVLLAVLIIAYLCGCQTRPYDPLQLSAADTVQPQQLYNKAKNYNAANIDTLYHNLSSALSDRNRYELLKQHLYYYKILGKGRVFPQALIAECNGFMEYTDANYTLALHSFDTAAGLYEKIHSERGLSEVYMGKGLTFSSSGVLDSSLVYNYRSLLLYERAGDSLNIYDINTRIASTLIHQKKLPEALSFLKSCLNYYQDHGMLYKEANVEDILIYAYSDAKQYDPALEHALKALVIRKKLLAAPSNHTDTLIQTEGISETFNNLATIYSGLAMWDKAITYYDSSLQLVRQTGHINQIPIIQQNIANAMIATGRFTEAEHLLKEAESGAVSLGRKQVLVTISQNFSTLYTRQGNYEKALDYFRKYDAYKDSLFNREKETIISELNIRYESGRKEAQIAHLHNQTRVDAIKKWLYLLALGFVAVIGTLMFLYLNRRNRANQLLAEKRAAELQANRKELQSFTESILSKNKLIEQMELQLQAHAQTISVKEDSETLSELYQLKILTEEDWQHFKMLFDKVYPGYIHRMRAQFPSLTPAEERQSLLTKLNLDNKECADMLGISISGVKKNKYRLKKRFNLAEEDSLEDFVRNF